MFEKFEIAKPIIQAPMAGITTPSFVATCCEAGILGAIGAGYLDGEETRQFIRDVKARTSQPFSINLFIQGEPKIDVFVLQGARSALQPIYEKLGIPNTQKVVSTEVFEGQIEVIIEEKVAICSFTFGLPSMDVIKRLQDNGTYLIGTATTLQEALAVEAAGLDAVVVQGSEAGGHRGSFTEDIELISTTALLEQVVGQVKIPVIAAGGIMTAQQRTQMMDLGAAGVQIGTALLTADECEVSNLHKTSILQSQEKATTLTKAFTGKFARGLKNDFTEQLEGAVVAPYPLQHYLTLSIRRESGRQGRPEYQSLWMGENSHLAQAASVEKIIADIMA